MADRSPADTIAAGIAVEGGPEVLASVALALRGFRRASDAAHRPVPPAVHDLERACAGLLRDTRRQPLAQQVEPVNDESMANGSSWSLPLTDAAAHARVSVRTLQRRVGEGRLRAIRLPGSRLVRIPVADLAEFMRGGQ